MHGRSWVAAGRPLAHAFVCRVCVPAGAGVPLRTCPAACSSQGPGPNSGRRAAALAPPATKTARTAPSASCRGKEREREAEKERKKRKEGGGAGRPPPPRPSSSYPRPRRPRPAPAGPLSPAGGPPLAGPSWGPRPQFPPHQLRLPTSHRAAGVPWWWSKPRPLVHSRSPERIWSY